MRYLSRLYAASIWHPDAIDPLEEKYADQKRVLWPTVDVLYILIGLTAAHYGAPSITAVFGPAISAALCLTFSFVSFAALVGVAFPCLWLVESLAKVVLVGAHAAFVLSLFSAAIGLDSLSRLYLIGFVGVSASHIMFRLHILRRERLEREAKDAPEDDA